MKLPHDVRRLARALESAYIDSAVTDEQFDALVGKLGTASRALTPTQREALNERLAAARDSATRAQLLADVVVASAAGARTLASTLPTGDEVWHVATPSGEAVIVVPAQPEDLSSAEAQAVAARRQALLTGTCKHCTGGLQFGTPTLHFAHQRRCLAA